MASPAQILANRENSQASTGPRTPEGKAAIAGNARKFGLFASTTTASKMAPAEAAEYQVLFDRLQHELQPGTLVEEGLVNEIVRAMWRLRRCEIVESTHEFSDTPDSDAVQIAIDRARSQANATLRRSHDTLSRLQTERVVRACCPGLPQGASPQGAVRQREVLQAIALNRRIAGLHNLKAVIQRALDAPIPGFTNQSQSRQPSQSETPVADALLARFEAFKAREAQNKANSPK